MAIFHSKYQITQWPSQTRKNRECPNVSTTPITAMGCRQCLPLSVVQLKDKHCQKTHCHKVMGFQICSGHGSWFGYRRDNTGYLCALCTPHQFRLHWASFYFLYDVRVGPKKVIKFNLIFLSKLQIDPQGESTIASSKDFLLLLQKRKLLWGLREPKQHRSLPHISQVSNIESDNSQNVGLEDYNNISDGIFPHFTTPSIKITLGQKELENSFKL